MSDGNWVMKKSDSNSLLIWSKLYKIVKSLYYIYNICNQPFLYGELLNSECRVWNMPRVWNTYPSIRLPVKFQFIAEYVLNLGVEIVVSVWKKKSLRSQNFS